MPAGFFLFCHSLAPRSFARVAECGFVEVALLHYAGATTQWTRPTDPTAGAKQFQNLPQFSFQLSPNDLQHFFINKPN